MSTHEISVVAPVGATTVNELNTISTYTNFPEGEQ
jgi:hypothetical protein